MDFDDLLFYTFLLFRDHPEVLARYQEQFRYILVAEYQDTNFAQHSIVLQLAKNHQHCLLYTSFLIPLISALTLASSMASGTYSMPITWRACLDTKLAMVRCV